MAKELNFVKRTQREKNALGWITPFPLSRTIVTFQKIIVNFINFLFTQNHSFWEFQNFSLLVRILHILAYF